MIKNSQPFGKKFQKTVGGIFLTHSVYIMRCIGLTILLLVSYDTCKLQHSQQMTGTVASRSRMFRCRWHASRGFSTISWFLIFVLTKKVNNF